MVVLEHVVVWLVDHPYVVVAFVVLYVLGFLYTVAISGPKPGKNPFPKDTAKPPQPVVLEQKKRDAVIKQAFHVTRIPQNLDAVVIGSGAGGLVVANILARAGKRCLVLEQHDQAGGCCHTFAEKGFEFDIGIHYIGEMEPGRLDRFLLDQLTDGQLDWVPLEKTYDIVALGTPGSADLYPQVAGRQGWRDKMVEMFPEDKDVAAIDKLVALRRDVRRSMMGMMLPKFKSRWLCKFLIKTGLLSFITKYFTLSRKTLSQTLDEITDNLKLKAVMSYCFGDYGTFPSDTSFVMQALLLNHFNSGGSYPVGGASEIAMHLIPPIERVGGRVLVRAPVKEILFSEKGRANGVRVGRSSGDIDIRAKLVISDAGVINTFTKLLPPEVAQTSSISRLIHDDMIRSGHGAFSVFVGLEGSGEELGLRAQNIWAFTGDDVDGLSKAYFRKDADDAATDDVPLLFISFPSTKDPTWGHRYPGKSTCVIVTLTPYRWFAAWRDERVMKRGADYEALKMAIAERMWAQVVAMFPALADKREYISAGSPLSNEHYIAAPGGEIYGLDHNLARYASPEVVMELRPRTDVRGLVLTGQDVMSCGFAGAVFGGLMAATAILHRNVLEDLTTLMKARHVKKEKEA